MAELTIDTADITAALRKNLEGFSPEVEMAQVGRIIEVGDGIARVSGLPGAAVNELLEFEGGSLGLALNLDEESIGAVVLGEVDEIEEGQTVKATGNILQVPVGDGLLGRVVNTLGEPIDGKGPLTNVTTRRMEVQAPGIIGRQPVHEPLQTGIKAIDAMTPIGRGQRELIIGDRKTGKTTIAVDTIINQKGLGVNCIYVAIGQKASTVAQTVATLETHGAMDYTVVVVAPASDPAPFKYLAPYSGCAMGQHWMDNGEHALAVYDDLSKQAEAYRQISLLLRRPPGREAYPGDVFYLHSRLLERAAKLSKENGSGSLTALPVIETKAGDISAYIPTNVISITDGQVFLQDDLFKSGVRPAVDVGQSVSRVGGDAQIKAMKTAVGTLKSDLAQFRELEAFATFGSELDKISQAQLDRGYRLTELLKQGLNSPLPVEEQVVSLFAGTRGHLDGIPVTDVLRFESELHEYFRTRHSGVLDAIRSTGKIDDEEAF
ncbi:F0F1 ATP synthase subunit alpha [soil metagenome]